MPIIQPFISRLTQNIETVIVGKRDVIELLMVALLCEGHVLLEDVPGTGKTMLARSLAISLGGSFKRLQCTPDLLPNDVTGVSVYNQGSGEFEFRPGPIFVNILLADEINRATPRTQSALLEAMQEQQVTVDGITRPLPRPFLGETVPMRLYIKNTGWLPLPWLHLRESLPPELFASGSFQRLISLPPKGHLHLEYYLNCRKRGYYPIGPLDLASGDVLGVSRNQWRRSEPQYIAVFPKIIPLKQVRLPSHAPIGTLRAHQPIYEDPSRVRGKRDYIAGDSLRRIDWKTSAVRGKLQVKLLEPSISLEAAIFLNLNADEYDLHTRFDIPELAIVVAASLANWVSSLRQSVGLVTNGADPLLDGQLPLPLPPRRGRGHLMRILETLARIQVAPTYPFVNLLRQEASLLPWGTTLIVVTNALHDDLFDALFHARRAGLSILLIQCGRMANFDQLRKKASLFGLDVQQVIAEEDLDQWRRLK